MNNFHPPVKKQYVTNAFKYLLAVSSMAGTFGIWNLLANKDLTDYQNDPNIISITPTEFSPLPTLVPVLQVDLESLQKGGGGPVSEPAAAVIATPLREVAQPTAAPKQAPIVLSNGSSSSSGNQNTITTNPSNPVSNPPPPVTTTQSSKP